MVSDRRFVEEDESLDNEQSLFGTESCSVSCWYRLVSPLVGEHQLSGSLGSSFRTALGDRRELWQMIV